MAFESEQVEFKAQLSEEIYKEVVAFANTGGGVLYLGVDDEGQPVGLEDVDHVYTRLTNGIRDAIQPDVTMFIHYTLQEDRVIRVEVAEGSSKPYYLRSKGLKPSGVYVRQGASSAPASPDLIRRMIKDSDGDTFESMRSLRQDLTFQGAEEAFARQGVEFGPDKFAALGLRSLHDGQFTNLALLLSDQCQHTVKIAVFADDSRTVFQDAKEFGGSLFRQLEDAYSYLLLCNRTAATFQGLQRVENPDYPEEALREGLLNAMVHRDFSFSGSIIINVSGSAMEFISLGGLLPGLSVEDIRSGISQPRNRNLAEIFHRLKLIESYGTGIRRIYKLYEGCPIQPQIQLSPNVFKLVLPNRNKALDGNPQEESSGVVKITPQMKMVLDYLREYGEMGDQELQDLLGVKRTRAYLVARSMVDAGLIQTSGRGASKRYRLK